MSWAWGLQSFETLSNRDQLVFTQLFNPFVNNLEQVLRRHSAGLETRDNVDVLGDICLALIGEPGARQVWERTKPFFFAMSRDYIQTRLDQAGDLPPRVSELMPWHGPGETRGE